MVINKFISVNQIIENVYRNAGYQKVPYYEAIEHIGRCIALFGINESFINKITDGDNYSPIEVVDFKAELPLDLVKLNGVRDWNTKTVLTYSTDTFHLNSSNTAVPSVGLGYEDITTDWSDFQSISRADINSDVDAERRFFNYKENYERDMNLYLEKHFINSTSTNGEALKYMINNNFIITNFETGWLELSYLAYPIDAEGYPMIPDDEIYKRAVETYLQERIDYILWRQGRLNEKIYKDSVQDKHWTALRLRSHIGVPTVDQMESIKNMTLRLIQDKNSHASGFRYNSDKERMWRVGTGL